MTHRNALAALLVAFALPGLSCGGPTAPKAEPIAEPAPATLSLGQPRVLVSETEPMLIDRIYHSMTGPFDLIELAEPELTSWKPAW